MKSSGEKKDKHEFVKNQILFTSKKVIRNWGSTANFSYQIILFCFAFCFFFFITHGLVGELARKLWQKKKIQTTAEGKFVSKYCWSV